MGVVSSDPIDVALLVAAAVTRTGGNYFVGGSLASSLQGEPRATNDIDLVVDLPATGVRDLVRELDGRWLRARSGIMRRWVFAFAPFVLASCAGRAGQSPRLPDATRTGAITSLVREDRMKSDVIK